MKRVITILTFLLFHNFLLASNICDDAQYVKFYDSIRVLNFAFQPEKSIEITSAFLEEEHPKPLLDCEIYHWILYEYGHAFQLNRNYSKSLEVLYDLVLKAKEHNYYQIEAESYLTIALVYEFIDQRKECSESLKAAYTIINRNNIEESLPRYYIRMSSHKRIIGDQMLAKEYARKAVDVALKIGDIDNELDGNLLLGNFTEDPDQAIKYFERASELFEKRGGYSGAASQTINASSILVENHRLKEASDYLYKAYNQLRKSEEHNKDYFSTLSYLLTMKKEIFIKQNMLDSALYYSEKNAEIIPNIVTYTNLSELEETSAKFKLEIEKQKAEKLKSDAQNLRKVLYLGGFSLILLALMAYLINRNRKKIKTQNNYISNQNTELIAAQKRSDMLLSEIHHRVKNNLQNIISLTFFKKNDAKSDNEKALLEDIRSKIISTSLIYENLYTSGEFEHIDVSNYIEKYVRSLDNSTLNPGLIVAQRINVDMLNIETMIPLGLLISELFSQSISISKNHPNKLNININIDKDKSNYIFKYTQKNSPYSSDIIDSTNTSTGINIIKSMCRQLRGTYTFHNTSDGIFEFRFEEKTVSKI